MKIASTLIPSSSMSLKVKRLRIGSLLTQRELADLAGVPPEHVDLFERAFPLPLDSKRRILKALWAIKVKK